jgi:hypothetical protein
MLGLNLRDYNLELELSIPESIPCTKREVWFPITNIDFPTFEVVRDVVGWFPNLAQGRDLSNGVEEGYEPKFYDYYSVPRVNKKGVYKIHCSMFIKTENDKEIKQCLDDWLQKICDNIYVPSVIKGYSKDNGTPMSEEIKCTKTFISNLKEDSICDKKYIDFTFMCDEMIEENKQ